MSLRIEGLTKSFDDQPILRSLDLDVDEGELIAIVGPSGCGKSTLLRCVAGLEKPDKGKIYIDNELINDKEPKDRNIAMVFQYYALYPHMTVEKNMSLGLKHTTTLSDKEIKAKVNEVSSLLNISHLLDRRPHELSGGEVQRVAIGRAIVRKPRVFLLDEPLTAIDARFRRELRFEIRALQKKIGVTTMFVTHDQAEAMAIGDRLVVLKDGVIQQIGSPEEIYYHPRNEFVATFVGKVPINLLQVRAMKKGETCYLEGESFSYELSPAASDSIRTSNKDLILLGIRPESIKMLEGPSKNSIKGTTSLVENEGNINYVHISLGNGELIAITSSEVNRPIGQELWISFEEKDILLFDRENGESLV